MTGRMTRGMTRQDNLRRLLAPGSVAFIGGNDAAIAAEQCAAMGFEGPIWGVNPRRSKLGGQPCVANLAELPATPDAAFLAVPRQAAVTTVAELRRMGFPVWSQHVSCQGTVKNTPGSVNVPISLGHQVVVQGDVVCADDDGVVVVARHEAAWALQASRERLAQEEEVRAKLAAGELGLDLYGLRDKLTAMGVQWVDSLHD